MGEENAGVTIRIPAPRALAEAVAKSPDARTAEVLRALHRAKGTIARADTSTSAASTNALVGELVAIREWLSKTTPITHETAQRLTTNIAVLERAVVVPNERLSDFQRGQDAALRELRESVHSLKRQSDALAAWRSRWTGQMAAWGLVLALLFAGGAAFSWRTHRLAQNTYDVLEQILEKQTKAQAAKGGKRR